MPQHLLDSYDRLQPHFQKLSAPNDRLARSLPAPNEKFVASFNQRKDS